MNWVQIPPPLPVIYAVSLMERTSGYGPEDMGSTPVLRAIGFSLAEKLFCQSGNENEWGVKYNVPE